MTTRSFPARREECPKCYNDPRVGIDIGGLSGANVPPGKASYQQRSGRAGRRNDGSTLVAMFARSMGYDQEVFRNFGTFFGKQLRVPTIFLSRERFGRAHLNALLLGEFFRIVFPDRSTGAMDAFGKMGWFCRIPTLQIGRRDQAAQRNDAGQYEGVAQELPVWWLSDRVSLEQHFRSFLQYLVENPANVAGPIHDLMEGTPPGQSEVSELINSSRRQFESCAEEWLHDYRALLDAWKEENKKPTRSVDLLNAIAYQSRELARNTVIEELASSRYLPRYGFPIGLQGLKVPPDSFGRDRSETVKLERDGLTALSEYVPGSTLLAGGRYFSSRGMARSFDKDGEVSALRIFASNASRDMCSTRPSGS